MVIDCHCHLDGYENIDEIVNNMPGIMIVSGYDRASNLLVLDLVNKYKNVYGTIGYHPDQVGKVFESDFDWLEKNVNKPKIVGIGEIGLDYHYEQDSKEQQKELFVRQINIANKANKPIVIHSRDAIQDTYDILQSSNCKKIYMHCFSGSLEMALKFIKMNAYLGVGGVVTYKNAKKLQEVVQSIDLSSILLETDSPYLTPEPHRGEINEPRNIMFVAEKISQIKQIECKKVLSVTTINAIRLFDLPM